jgi:hypothetical protein
MATPAIQTLLTDAQQVLNLNSLSEVRSTMAAALANANVGTPLNPNLTTQQLWDEFYLIVRQPESDIESIITNQLMKFLFAPPAPGGAGANHEVIYNNNGVLAGDPKFLWDDALNKLDIDGSATISGDLTVDTSTLKVDSSNDRVGIGIAAPAYRLHVQGTASLQLVLQSNDTNANAKEGTVSSRHYTNAEEPVSVVGSYATSTNNYLYVGGGFSGGNAATSIGFYTAANSTTVTGTERYNIASDGVATWSNVGGVAGTAMTLNSTGLGVGVSPSFNIHARGTTDGRIQVEGASGYGMVFVQASSGNTAQLQLNSNGGSGRRYVVASNTSGQFLIGDETAVQTRLLIDSAGNVGIGVTPSAWGSGKAIEVLEKGYGIWNGTGSSYLLANAYFNSGFKYANTGSQATHYYQYQGTHVWSTAASGTAGNAITFTQAMTLDASGNLLVGTTSLIGVERFNVTKTTVGSYLARFNNTNTTVDTYGVAITYTASTPNDASHNFLGCVDSVGSRALIYANGGLANYSSNNVNLSDARTKTDIKPLASYWNKIKALELVTFKYKDQTHNDDNIGLISQQVESVAPEFVSNDGFGETPADGVPLKSIYTTDLYHASIKALQEAMARIEALEAKLA